MGVHEGPQRCPLLLERARASPRPRPRGGILDVREAGQRGHFQVVDARLLGLHRCAGALGAMFRWLRRGGVAPRGLALQWLLRR